MKAKILILTSLALFSLSQHAYPEMPKIKRVIIISVDALNSDYLFNCKVNEDFYLTPNIGELIREGCVFKNTTAVMPTLTQVNHVTILCGCYADKVGFIGNVVYDKETHTFRFPWEEPELIKADTIMKSLNRENKNIKTAVIAGKNYVGCPIWAQYTIGPSCISESIKKELPQIKKFPSMFGYMDSPDHWAMDNALAVLKKIDPNMMLLHLPFVDPAQHNFGHASAQALAAISWADYQIGRLIKYLKESNKLKNTLIVFTSDHGQQNVWEKKNLKKILIKAGIKVKVNFSEGNNANIFLEDKTQLNEAVALLKQKDYIDGIWTGDEIDKAHLRTPYTGDIIVSTRSPYEALPFMIHLGGHAGRQERFVPLAFTGPSIKRGEVIEKEASLTDIVPTICALTGWKEPKDVQGNVLPVVDKTNKWTPELSYHFREYTHKRIGYIPIFFFICSIFLFIAVFHKKEVYKLLLFQFDEEITKATVSVPLSLVICFTLLISAVLFTLLCNLFSIPGIQPDSFVTALRFHLWSSAIVLVPYDFFFFSLGIWLLGILIIAIAGARLTKKGNFQKIMCVLPYAAIYLLLFLIIFEIIQLLTPIPYQLVFILFNLFFWTGFILSLTLSIIIFKNLCAATALKSIIIVGIIGLFTIAEFLFMVLYVIFPSYLVSVAPFYNFLYRIIY